jgi:zinc protease
MTRSFALSFVALLAVCAAACIAGPVTPVTAGVIAYPSSQITLASGTRAVFEVSPDFGAAGVVLVMSTGSSDDPPGKEGLAHLVEHLVFHSRHEHDLTYQRKLQALGAGAKNATTNWDTTTFYAFGPAASLSGFTELLAGIADDPLAGVDENAFEHERAVVLDELHSRAEDGTPGQIFGFLHAATFPAGHPYARSVIGSESSIVGLTLADAVAFAKANYRPSKAVLASSGPVPIAEQEATVQRIAGQLQWAPAKPELRSAEPLSLDVPDLQSRQIETHELPVSTPALWMAWSIPSEVGAEADAATVVAAMVDGAFAEHVYDHDWDIAYVDAGVSPGARSSLFYVSATLKEGSHPQTTASSLLSTMMHGLGERTYLATPFGYYRQALGTELLDREQSLVGRTLNVAKSVDLTGSATFLRGGVDRIAALTPDRVADFYHRYLTSERAHAFFVKPLPGNTPKRAEPARSLEADLASDPTSVPTDVHEWMRAPNVAAAARTTLPNGMEAVVLPRPGSSFHSLVVAYHGGYGMEQRTGAALASLWAKERIGLHSGTWGIVYHDRVTLDSTFEAVRSTGADIGLTLHRLDQENQFRIFWPPSRLSSRLEVYDKQDRAPNGVFGRTLEERFFGSNPYGAQTTAAKLRDVAPNDVYTYIDAIRRPSNGIAVIVGDVDPGQTTQLLASDLGRGPPEERKPVRALPPLETLDVRPGDRVFVINRPGSDTARLAFRCALPAVTRSSWGKYEVFAHAIGGRLFTAFRHRTSTSYSVYDDLTVLRGGTAFLAIGADIDHGHLAYAIATLRRVVEGAPASLIDGEGLTSARASAASQFNLQYGTPEQLAMAIVRTWNMDWPLDTIDDFPRQVQEAGLQDLTRLLEHCQRNWILGIMGDETRIRAAMGDWTP